MGEGWELNYQRDIYRDEYHALMKSRGVDFILCPAYVGVAPVLGESHYWNYTAIWNILDQPAVVFPSGLNVDSQLDAVDKSYQPRTAVDEREWKKYAPERYTGAPIGLQLVSLGLRPKTTYAFCIPLAWQTINANRVTSIRAGWKTLQRRGYAGGC